MRFCYDYPIWVEVRRVSQRDWLDRTGRGRRCGLGLKDRLGKDAGPRALTYSWGYLCWLRAWECDRPEHMLVEEIFNLPCPTKNFGKLVM